MQFMGDYIYGKGYNAHYLAPDHLEWKNPRPINKLNGEKMDAIIRFFPLEWLTTLPKSSKWVSYFNSNIPSCNHPIAMLTQSKRLPLVWDQLSCKKDTWKQMLPKTIEPKLTKKVEGDWIYKPALGRVGEGISIKGAIPPKEVKKITKAALRSPKNWIAQQMFYSQPFITEEKEEMHICIGVFTVDGKRAGFYGRVSPYIRIDANAKDIPILIVKENNYE